MRKTALTTLTAICGISVHDLLAERAALQPVGGHGLVALDWHTEFGREVELFDRALSSCPIGV